MPSHRVHCFADQVIFNRSFSEVHKFIDKPSLRLGSTHRELFHDETTARVMSEKLKDPAVYWSIKLHVALDWHPESYQLEGLLGNEAGRRYAAKFIREVYDKYVKPMGWSQMKKTLDLMNPSKYEVKTERVLAGWRYKDPLEVIEILDRIRDYEEKTGKRVPMVKVLEMVTEPVYKTRVKYIPKKRSQIVRQLSSKPSESVNFPEAKKTEKPKWSSLVPIPAP